MVRTGLEVLLSERLNMLDGRRVGVVTNHSAITGDFQHIADALLSRGVKLSALFGPEHGVRGEVADGVELVSGADKRTGLPVHSLYGNTKRPTPEMMEDVDVLVYDLQDAGSRFYTFTYTMAYCMETCAQMGRPFIVLDRPNPITGHVTEGMVLEPEFSSFIGLYPIPNRHGMTIGELARYFNKEFGINAQLDVIPCQGWKRGMWFEETGLPWVMPSPNMPTVDTAIAFAGFCDFEGTNMSEGRGMCRPFETFGAPYIEAYEYAKALNKVNLPGVAFRPTYFIPSLSKHQGKACGGVQAHITDRNSFRPVFAGLKATQVAHDLYPDDFQFREPNSNGKSHFDLVVGSDKPRLAIEAGKTAEEIAAGWKEGLEEFNRKREQYLLYRN